MIMEKHCYIMMLISILVLIIVDVCHNHDIHFRTIISRQNIVVRWVLYFGLIMSILILGVYGGRALMKQHLFIFNFKRYDTFSS